MKLLRVSLTCAGLLLALSLQASTTRVYITNAAGDSVHVIDPVTTMVIEEIKGCEIPSGVDFSPDGKRVYLDCEGDQTLIALDQKSSKIVGRVQLSGRPNSISITHDGKLMFIAIQLPGAVDIVDLSAMKLLKTIKAKGGVHYAYLTPDGKYAAATMPRERIMMLIDVKTLEPEGEFNFGGQLRPVAFEKGADGSTSRIFAQVGGLHGFEVYDFKTRKLLQIVKMPNEPISLYGAEAGTAGHGIAVAPDNKTLWVNSTVAGAVFAYSLPDLKLLGHTVTGDVPDWITFTPDSKVIYVSVAGENLVCAIDTKTFRELARIPVGQTPKRSGTLFIP
jgi:YVTN family beta-propeller protein